MASLFDKQIDLTYQGLVKFDDNGTVNPTTLKTLTDGTGGTLPLSLSQVETKFTSGSLVDFTGTTVTGLPVDPNTTYDLASAQDGTNVDITLTGSDATVDTPLVQSLLPNNQYTGEAGDISDKNTSNFSILLSSYQCFGACNISITLQH